MAEGKATGPDYFTFMNVEERWFHLIQYLDIQPILQLNKRWVHSGEHNTIYTFLSARGESFKKEIEEWLATVEANKTGVKQLAKGESYLR